MPSVDLQDVIRRLGWCATWKQLRSVATERDIRRAVESGLITRAGRGRYTLPGAGDIAQVASLRVNGVVSHGSAAVLLGIAVRKPPAFPTVIVPRSRNLAKRRRLGVEVHWADLRPDEVDGGVTTPLRTVLDCAALMPLAEALVVVDSALAGRLVTRSALEAAAMRGPKQSRARVLEVVAQADGRSQSAFESLVRGHSLEVPRLSLVPQVELVGCHPDLYDKRLHLAVECDSYEHHSKRGDLLNDCERYNEFALAGAMLIRFGWEHSMRDAAYVQDTLSRAVVVRERQLGLT